MDYDFKSELILRDFPIIRDKVYMKDGAPDRTNLDNQGNY